MRVGKYPLSAVRFSVRQSSPSTTPSHPPYDSSQSESYVEMRWLPSDASGSNTSPTQKVVETMPVCHG